jgi:nucleoside-diphosphate-sugar epimerase
MIEGKRILITGGAGFIGTNLVKRLADANKVVIYDNLHRNALAGTGIMDHPNVELIRGDVLNADEVAHSMAGSHLIVHLAAIAGVDTVLKMPADTMRVNTYWRPPSGIRRPRSSSTSLPARSSGRMRTTFVRAMSRPLAP